MNRRQMLSTLSLALAAACPKVFADGGNLVDYNRAAYDQALASGEPFVLDFFAPW